MVNKLSCCSFYLILPVAGEGDLGALGVLDRNGGLGGPNALGAVVLPFNINFVAREEGALDGSAALKLALVAVGDIAGLDGEGGLDGVLGVELVGDLEEGVLVDAVAGEGHSGVVIGDLALAEDLLLEEIVAGGELELVVIDGLAGGAGDDGNEVVGVGLELDLVLGILGSPLSRASDDLAVDVVVKIDGRLAVTGGVEGLLGKERLGSLSQVAKGISEADDVVVELERGLPVNIEAFNATDSSILDRCGDGL